MGASPTKVKDRDDLPESPRKNSPTPGSGDGTGKKQDPKSKKQHIKMVDLLELSNLLGQPMERIDYISTALERRGVYLEKGILGEGGSGYILKAFNDKDEKLAVKFVRCENAEQVKQSIMEYKILRQFNCDYITRVKELLQVERETETYHIIVMERCACDLKQFLRDVRENNSVLSKKFVLEICIQLIQGLDVLHQKNIIHLDIKPANILYGYDKKWKYADLGVSKTLSNERQHTTHLSGFTACYSSPEQFQMMSYNAKRDITKSSDIYSLGIVFLELTGMELNKKWLLQLKLQKPKGTSSNFNPEFAELNERIILPMIAYEPSERIELAEAQQILAGLLDNEIRGVAKQSLSPRKRSPNKHSSVHRARDDPNDIAVLQVLEKDDRNQQQQHMQLQQQQFAPKVSSQQSLMVVESLDQPDQQSSSIPTLQQEQHFSQHQQQQQLPQQQQLQPQQQQYIPPQQQPYRMQSLSSHQFLPMGQALTPIPNKVKKYTEPSNPQDNNNNREMPNLNDSPLIYSHRGSRMKYPLKYDPAGGENNSNLNNGKQKIIKLQMASELQKYASQGSLLPPLQQSMHIPSQEMQQRQHLYNEVTPTLLQHLPTQEYNNNNYNYNFSNALQQANNQFSINNNNSNINNNSNNYTPMYQSNLLNQNNNNNNSNSGSALQQQVLNQLQQSQLQQQQQPYYNNMQSPRGSNHGNNNNFSGAANNQNIISASIVGSRVPSPDPKRQKDSQNHEQISAILNRRHQRLGSLPLNFESFKSNLNQGGQQQQQRQSVVGGYASTRQPSPQNAGLEALAANPGQNGSQQYQQYLQINNNNNNSSQVKLPQISPLKKRSIHVSPSDALQQQPQQYIFLKEKKSISPFDFFPEQI